MQSELQIFVREALGRGLPRAAVREQLVRAGWRPEEIDAALDAWAETDFPVPVPRRRPYLSAREAFLYLVLFATLYTSAYNVGQVLFIAIERSFPDPLREAQMGRYAGEALRGATAAIIIAFPVFLLLSRYIGRMLEREPEKRGSAIRKWLTYVTLFVTALVIIGDLTVLVARMLGGEVPTRFLLKVAAVLAIAGTVFGHYLGDLRHEETESPATARRRNVGARLAAAGVFAVVFLGIMQAGLPGRARRLVFDDMRIEDLRALSGAVESYYREVGVLPDSLSDAVRPPRGPGNVRLVDPEVGLPYEYSVLDSATFELCAVFSMPGGSESGGRVSGSPDFFRHGEGRTCFRFAVRARGVERVEPANPAPPRREPAPGR